MKDLDDRYLECDALPDPEDEKDLHTFIEVWGVESDKTLEDCVKNWQAGEEVIRRINCSLAEARISHDQRKTEWYQAKIDAIRDISQQKCAHITLEFLSAVENYTKIDPIEEELKMLAKQAQEADGMGGVKKEKKKEKQVGKVMGRWLK